MTFVRPALVVSVGLIVLGCAAEDDGETVDLGPCVADAFEPSDSATSPWAAGEIQDDDDVPGSNETQQPNILKKTFTTHVSGDVDWFNVSVRDSGIGGNPQLSVIVPSTYEATAWFTCSNGQTESVICGLGDSVTADPEFSGRGCVTKPSTASSSSINVNLGIECSGTSTDSGLLTIRVRRLDPSTSCEHYYLTVSAN